MSQILRLANNVILASILYQEAFALMAITSAIIQALVMFSDIGLAPSVIQNRRGDERGFLDTAWTIQVIRGIVLTGIACALAWPMAAFYATNDPLAWELKWLLPLVALATLVSGFQSSKMMTASRHMNLAPIAIFEVVSQVIGLSVMAIAAWYTRSVYALAVGTVVTSIVHCSLSHLALPGERNKFHWDKSAVHEIVKFGKWVFLSTLLTFLAIQLDKLAFGKLFPLEVVGVYGIAASLALMTPMLMGRLQNIIAFPLYSRSLERNSNLEPIVQRSKLPMLTMGGFLVALSIACAQSFIELAYDERYAAAGLYIPLLAVGSWCSVVDGVYAAAFLATGRARLVAFANATKVVAFCGLLILASYLGEFMWAVLAVSVADMAKATFSMLCARSIGVRGQRTDALFTLLVAGVSLGVLWLTEHVPLLANSHPAITLLLQGSLVTIAFTPLFVMSLRAVLDARAK